MLKLAIDCSTSTAAAALQRDGAVVAEYFCNNGLNHSQTLLPAVQRLLTENGLSCAQLDEIAVTVGPGSFTGVRIGISTAKGLAMGAGIPVAGVSSLAAAAYSCTAGDGWIAACFDARCGQVYHAMFERTGGRLRRIGEDCAVTVAELAETIRAAGKPVFVCGDGAELVCGACPEAILAPEDGRFITGRGVLAAGEAVPARDFKEILPSYLRLSQAQREREKRLKQQAEVNEQ